MARCPPVCASWWIFVNLCASYGGSCVNFCPSWWIWNQLKAVQEDDWALELMTACCSVRARARSHNEAFRLRANCFAGHGKPEWGQMAWFASSEWQKCCVFHPLHLFIGTTSISILSVWFQIPAKKTCWMLRVSSFWPAWLESHWITGCVCQRSSELQPYINCVII